MVQAFGRRLVSCVPAAFTVVGALTCRLTAAPAVPARAATTEVQEVRDVTYYRGRPADAVRHRLDLFLPRGQKGYPVVMLVHGGAWMMGDKSCLGLYSAVGRFFARHGVGAVLPNYRLSPLVRHPEHVRDVARAFAWTHAHIAKYGGDPNSLFLAGHSAGSHLVALLATDESYLKAERLGPEDVKGVIGVSGVYLIPAGKVDLALGGAGPAGLRLDQLLPMPGRTGRGGASPLGFLAVPLQINFFATAFGDAPEVRAAASPLTHVRAGLPPFLLFSAERDLPTLPAGAETFYAALQEMGCDARLERVRGRNHTSVMFGATDATDPVASAMLEFIRRHAR